MCVLLRHKTAKIKIQKSRIKTDNLRNFNPAKLKCIRYVCTISILCVASIQDELCIDKPRYLIISGPDKIALVNAGMNKCTVLIDWCGFELNKRHLNVHMFVQTKWWKEGCLNQNVVSRW